MDYLKQRVKRLLAKLGDADWSWEQEDFLQELLEVLADITTIEDDLVDAADEMDMRLTDLEEKD